MNTTADALTLPAIRWHEQSKGFVRSLDGRFDLIHTLGDWVAIDWEHGRKSRHRDLDDAKTWCRLQKAGVQ